MRSFSLAVFAAIAAVASAASLASINDLGLTVDDLNAAASLGIDLNSYGLGDIAVGNSYVAAGAPLVGDIAFDNAGVQLYGGEPLSLDDAANVIFGLSSYGGANADINTLQVNPMVDMVAPGINVGSMASLGELAEFENAAFPGPGAIVNNYISDPIPDYQAVAGVLPLLGGANFLEGDGHIQTSADVAVPMPEVAIPLPETTDLTAALPTNVAFDMGAPSFEALLQTIVNGDIAGLGVAAADLVPEVVTYAGTPDVAAVPELPAVPDLAALIPTLSDDQIATLLVNHGADGFRVADMLANVNAYLGTATNNADVAVANGMNSVVNSAAENWQNIANIRESLADLLGGVQRDQSTAVKEGLATILAGAGESNEKTNLIAQALSSAFINTALDQQALVNNGVNNIIQSNVGNMDNANTIVAQLADAFSASQASNTPVLNDNLNALMALVAANTPQPTDGAVLNPGVPVGGYVAGASSAAVGNPALDALAGSADVSGLDIANYINGLAEGVRAGTVSYGSNGPALVDALSSFVTNQGWDRFMV